MGLISRVSSRTYRKQQKKFRKMGINRDSWHKRRKTGGRKPQMHKKRKFEMGRPASNTKIAPKRVHMVRTMGGNKKFRALRLDHGNFGWASEGIAKTTRIVDVVYNATSNELVRTKTLVKGAIVVVDVSPFRSFYENHYAQALGRKKGYEFSAEEKVAVEKMDNCGKETAKKYQARQKLHLSIKDLLHNFYKENFFVELVLDLVKWVELMDTCWKVKSWSFIQRNLRPRNPKHKKLSACTALKILRFDLISLFFLK